MFFKYPNTTVRELTESIIQFQINYQPYFKLLPSTMNLNLFIFFLYQKQFYKNLFNGKCQ